MSKLFSIEKTIDRQVDYPLVSTFILLLGIGTTTMYSASSYLGELLFQDSSHFLVNHLIRLCIGGLLTVVLIYIPINLLKKYLIHIMALSLVLLVLTYIPFISKEILGARRWIYLGPFSFQPSELVKLTLLIYLSYNFSKNENRTGEPHNTLIPPLVVLLFYVGFVYLQNDFSTSIFILLLGFLMFFVSGVSFRYILPIVFVSIPMSFIFLFSKPYRVTRLISFLFPYMDPSGSGYQILASKKALSLGGLWGLGPGAGVRKLGKLPEVYSDFIFAALGEELGYIGIVFVLFLFIFLAYRGFLIAKSASDRFQFYLATGITISIVLQVFLNVAVVSGLVPSTGIPLPFFSYGGSNILVTMMMIGILINISRGSDLSEQQLFSELSHG
ncbi:putative lipid II flippase FtsW [Spirochaeta cellobiosiphila]|uniref:putative lipid II flippase FtsW n=1 Tax=Spirochaeta cellobiosiphila TaxID=504483 RepID=UPI00040C1D70|nr:putative lipid II flippase FtsW [Spirochaeta cellobiosiphila]